MIQPRSSTDRSLRLEGLDFAYSSTPVLRSLSCRFDGGRTVLLGPNGAGKSTLFSLLSGVLTARSGAILLPGADNAASRRELRSRVGIMLQAIAPVPGLTVAEQVAYAGWLAGLSAKRAARRAGEVLEQVDLAGKADAKAGKLSGGQLRRVGLAQAIVAEPEVLLLDEPTAGLDPAQRLRFRSVLHSIPGDRVTVVSTHQVDDITELYDVVVVIEAGQMRFTGTPEEFLALADPGSSQAERAYLSLLQTEEMAL
ncbi:MAG: ATP-binding cassette domain-containing protein [Acidipropionibacterium sp.]|jgi:ABC-type multidrug transport system ATPase subunit|nr:ATP-binding cassette domain-containing protein [Acidipropionibacterium sp.]